MSLTQKIGQVIALSCLISGSFIPTALSSTAPQETIQKSESQTILAQRRGSAYVCTRDRNGYLNLRSGASLRNRIIGRINNRQYLTILRSSGNWYKVNYKGRIGWVSGDYVCKGNSSRPTRKTNSKKCNSLLASIKNEIKRRYFDGPVTKSTHRYTDSPVNRPHYIFFESHGGVQIGDTAFRRSTASQVIYNCKTVGLVAFGGFYSSGTYIDDAFGITSSGKVVKFQCLYARRRRRIKPRWGQIQCD
ncbi:MAG: SH3 domain-containing protein [Cyanobacteria bacterium J06633_8]